MHEWVIMFVDMVDSTGLKYRVPPDIVARVVEGLFVLIGDSSHDQKQIKFTGDGAMVVFKNEHDHNGCDRALRAADNIIGGVESLSFTFVVPSRIRVRIGIATGTAHEIAKVGLDLVGPTVDLAARLCAEASTDGILVDHATKAHSTYPDHRFELCQRRLSLKGVPVSAGPEHFYEFKARRFLRMPVQDPYSRGLVALYSNREALSHDLAPVRLISFAAPGSTMLVAGRSLIAWTKIGTELTHIATSKSVKFRFLLCAEKTWNYIEQKQRSALREDYPRACRYFTDLAHDDPTHFECKESTQLILDGISCARILLPGERPDGQMTGKLIALQDINAASDDLKGAALWVCTCNGADEHGDGNCMAHGLYRRTMVLFGASARITAQRQSKLQRLVGRYSEGMGSRKNHVRNYVSVMAPYFRCIDEGKLDKVPPPLCVQAQVSSKCSTHCKMCDHWEVQTSELSSEKWNEVFSQLSQFGVKTVIFSGGEPLVRKDIVDLLESANANNLKIGLITNGTIPIKNPQHRQTAITAIARCVEWVAVSIDGTENEDLEIRHPQVKNRTEMLKEFCGGILAQNRNLNLSATVTLQKDNVRMDFREVSRFIVNEIGIPYVNYKLATGARQALAKDPDYLLSSAALDELIAFLWRDSSVWATHDNFSYLRRCFLNGTFDKRDSMEGVPLRSFYARNPLRCYIPFVFALIDSNGDVYPCCHLYRDNHGVDTRSKDFRDHHHMGNVRDTRFEEIWNGTRYVEERDALKTVNPNSGRFLPCGECTRYCQHNLALTRIHEAYSGDLKRFTEEVKVLGLKAQSVWF